MESSIYMKIKLLFIFWVIFSFGSLAQSNGLILHTIRAKPGLFLSNACLDSSDNIYITGNYTGVVYFGNDSIKNLTTAQRIFIFKLDSLGAMQWILEDTSNITFEAGLLIKPDKQGNMIVLGSGYAFGCVPPGHQDPHFLLNITKGGSINWIACFDSDDFFAPKDFETDNHGNVFVTGFFKGKVYFGNDTLSPTNHNGGNEIFLAKFDSAGTFAWARKAGTNVSGNNLDNDEGSSICVDTSGNVYITGMYTKYCQFQTQTLYAIENDIFVAKYDKMGNFIWVKNAHRSKGGNYSTKILYGHDNKIVLSGNLVGNGSFFGPNINLGLNNSKKFFANFNTDFTLNWIHLTDKPFKAYYDVPHDMSHNIDPASSDVSYVTLSNDTINDMIINSISLYELDSVGKIESIDEIVRGVSNYFGVKSLNINSRRDKFLTCYVPDTITINNNVIIPPPFGISYLIYKIPNETNHITGRVYHDMNNNGVFDANDMEAEGVLVYLEDEVEYEITDSEGYYSFKCDTGSYNVRIALARNCNQISPTIPTFYPLYLQNDSTTISNLDFAITCNTSNLTDTQQIRKPIVFPNPTNSLVHVDLQGIVFIDVTNQYGQHILRTDNSSINLCEFPSGIYFLNIRTKNGVITRLVVKQQ